MKIAVEEDIILRIETRPGQFVWDQHSLLSAYPIEAVSKAAAKAIRTAFVIGPERSPEQDLEFAVGRIVEIAQRALSPGVNDPTTAVYCIDRLGEVFSHLGERKPPSTCRADENGALRVLAQPPDLGRLTCSVFAAVAHYGKDDESVRDKLRDTIDALLETMPPTYADGLSAVRDELLIGQSRADRKERSENEIQ